MLQVETYEQDEVAEETVEVPEEVGELIEKMGLEGQKKLLCKNIAGQTTRCPFPAMTADQQWVLMQLCPTHMKLGEYERCAVPLRVLKTASFADSLGYFEELQVWDAAGPVGKDPVLVGKTVRKGRYGDEAVYHMLARWGEHLDEWPALMARACEQFKASVIARCKEIIASATTKLEVFTKMEGLEVRGIKIPTYYD